MSKILTYDEFREHIQKNGMTKAKTTKKYRGRVPEGTTLFFGLSSNGEISTYKENGGDVNKDFGYTFDHTEYWNDDGGSMKFEVMFEEKLIKKDMEEKTVNEIKDFPKDVLEEANSKVLEEIKDERVVKAMTCLRGMYDEKNELEKQTKVANDKIKEITKDLKVVSA